MGWTYMAKPENVKEELANLLTFEDEERSSRALDVAIKLKEAYAAVESIDKTTGERKVEAVIFLLDYRKNDPFGFGYKDMDERMGPYAFNCPEKILDLLTPTDHKHAAEWREACREALRKTKAAPKITQGSTVKLSSPLRYSDGVERQSFYCAGTKPRLFYGDDGRLVRLPSKKRLAEIGYTVTQES